MLYNKVYVVYIYIYVIIYVKIGHPEPDDAINYMRLALEVQRSISNSDKHKPVKMLLLDD